MPEPLLATEANPTTEGQTGKESGDSSSTETAEQTQQTVEEKAAAEKTATEKAAAEKPAGAPETYEFKNPDGVGEVEIDKKIHDAYAEAARELDLPQEKAQGLFDKTMTALHKYGIEEQNRQTDEWIKTAKADPEFGGEKLDENLGIAAKAVKEFGSDGLRELLDSPHGVGNHPELIRFLVKVGRAVSEDRFVGSNKGETTLDDDVAKAHKLYPSHR